MPIAFGGGIFGGGGGGVSGVGASDRLALWSGTGTLTSDAGLTYSGTGDAGVLRLGALGDLSLSRSAAGVLAVGTGAAGSNTGQMQAATFQARVDATDRIAFQWGTSGTGRGSIGGTGASPYEHRYAGMYTTAFTVGVDGAFGFTSDANGYSTALDTILSRRAPATLQLGAADSGTPVPQTLTVQGATGTNTAGQDWTVTGSLGTGTAASGKIVFKVGTPTASGSTQHTPVTGLTIGNHTANGSYVRAEKTLAAGSYTDANNYNLLYLGNDNTIDGYWGIPGLYLAGKNDGTAVNQTLAIGTMGASPIVFGFQGSEAGRFAPGFHAKVTVTSNPGTAAPAAIHSRSVYTNTGDTNGSTIILPPAAAGLQFTFYVDVAQTMTIVAAGDDTIRIGASVTAAGGSITNATTGSSVTLTAISDTRWVATSIVGAAWTF